MTYEHAINTEMTNPTSVSVWNGELNEVAQKGVRIQYR
jgi:hypothetical protein